LIGDFASDEILGYKSQKVESFIPYPINPQILLERLNSFFKVKDYSSKKMTPMLFDLNAKGNILVVQIEGNLDPGKLEILNYRIRGFFHQKRVSKPKILFIFPSLYPETLTKENIDVLFRITKFEEFKIEPKNIKILTNKQILLDLINEHEVYSKFDRVPNYYDGMQLLNTDFDKHKEIPVEYLKIGSSYIFDLYDDEGDIRIPLKTKITEEIKTYLLKTGINKLSYYSGTDLIEATDSNAGITNDYSSINQFDMIMSNTDNISPESTELSFVNEKMQLFLNKLKGQNILIVSNNTKDKELIKKTLNTYMDIDSMLPDEEIQNKLDGKKYILVFLDHTLENPTALEMLKKIRLKAGKKEVSVIIIAKNMNKLELARYKTSGTDYVLLAPFSSEKLQYRIFNSIVLDRKS